ncbi:MAG: polyphosphate kinase 1, partial [Chloroflexi bacterium]|nr:polyphosphate kinase 1 [Chloroflexota bacterium]
MKTRKKKKSAPATPGPHAFLNRELSWLEFNQRVLLEACNPAVPLLERLKFLSITGSNLDEFCMVRVGGLKMLVAANVRRTDPSGMTPRQQLVAVTRRMRKMVADQYGQLALLSGELAGHGFVIQESVAALTGEQRTWLEHEFTDNIFPLLSPVGVGGEHPFRPAGLLPHCVAMLAPAAPDEAPRMVFIPLGPKLPRFIRIPDAEGRAVFIPVEQVVAWQVAALAEGQPVLECVPFRVTRNADIELREDLSADLLEGMRELLDDRRETECIRLEIHSRASRALVGAMRQLLGLDQSDVYLVDGPVELRSLMSITQTDGFEDLRDEPWEPVPSPDVDIKESMFPQIAQGDILLVHPYDSFDPVVKFISDAADDPQVLAIKQVLYRTAPQSAIIEALIGAAQVGKHVTVLIELKARFDEARNISQARRLELAGAHVVYGVRALKTHAKICLVVRREPQGIARYVHFGTGNYNEKTATLYSDAGLFTCRNDFGADASDVFNAITGYSQPQSLRRLEVA